MKGRVLRGSARLLVLADADSLLPGGLLLKKGPFENVFLIHTRRSTGGVNIFAMLEDNVGKTVIDKFVIAPYAPGLEASAGSFPEHAKIVKCNDN